MASYKFTWPHAANEVYVTGTFDNWAKTEKLEKVGDVFSKTVQLSNVDDKIMYKFVVDGNWTTDHLAPSETDHSGIVNNILLREHLTTSHPTISSAAPSSTTAALAGQIPLENEQRGPTSELPGQFPETPGFEPQSFSVNPIPATAGAGNPVKLAPGEQVPSPTSYTSNTINSNVKLDQDSYEKGESAISSLPADGQQSYSVKPLPATAGAGNPVNLAPGEKVPEPSSFTTSTVNSNVKLDKDSYEKAGSFAPQLPPVLSYQEQREAEGAAMFGLPAVGGTMIPESSLPMGDQFKSLDNPTISSIAPQSTTAQLAGQQPIQPRGVPSVVTDSQETAHVPPEAASSVDAVQEKSQVEEELKAKVPEAPATSESGLLGNSEKGIAGVAAGGLAAAGAAATSAAYLAKDKIAAATGQQSDATISSVSPQSTTAQLAGQEPVQSRSVPEVVTDSQETAHVSPEASSSAQAVLDKSHVEDELKEKIPEAPATSESGFFGKSERGYVGAAIGGVTAAGAALASAAYAARDRITETTSEQSGNILPVSVQDTDREVVGETQPSTAEHSGVPEVVVESQQQAHASPEASANPEAVMEKAAVEQELEQKVALAEESGAPAPTASAALASTAPATTAAVSEPVSAVPVKTAAVSEPVSAVPVETAAVSEPVSDSTKTDAVNDRKSELQTEARSVSRDVSPMTKTDDSPALSTTPAPTAAPTTPQMKTSSVFAKNTPDSSLAAAPSDTASPAESKKSKRRSFFGKIKDKFRS